MAARNVRVRVESRRATVITEVNKVMRRKVAAMGVEYRRTLVEEVLVGQRYGREYTLPGTLGKKTWRASRPGEPPATRLGDLRRSYKVGRVEETAGRASVKVGSPLDYAEYLEHNMNREHLEPAAELAKPRLEAILRGEWGI